MSQSAIYEGWVMHRRLKPKVHRFKYRVFSLLLELDELATLDRMRLFAWNRRGLFSFHDRDHGPAGCPDLRGWLDGLLAQNGIAPGGRKRVLCYPRILGHVFNPLSVWFCDGDDGALKAIIYEVHNTYDEGHCYVFPVHGGEGGVVRQETDKDFYVSPFLAKDHRYHFRIAPPGENVAIAINETREGDAILNASFAGARRALTDAALLRLFFRYPLMTLKVVAAIHFEAVRLMLKGIRRQPHAPLAEAATWARNPR